MQINMTTFAARPQPYIDKTMESLFESDWVGSGIPLNLIMGSEDLSHVQKYAGRADIRVIPWDLRTNRNLRWNCTLNKIRALRHGGDEAIVICEDDITFNPFWIMNLREAAADMGDGEYVLSLFAATPELKDSKLLEGTTLVREYPGAILQGAQGLYYPNRAIRLKVADYLRWNLESACGDELIGRCARENGGLFATREILVNHVGAVSCFPDK